MTSFSLRSALIAAFVLSNCIQWTTSRHHYTHNVSGHRSRHRRQGQGLFLSASYVIPGGEGTGWGEWGEVSPCSRTCGGGVASQKRICLQIGSDGQPQCSGGDTKYFSCQTQDCPPGAGDFRAQQCSEYDQYEFRNIKYKWVPYTKAPNPCELNCMPHAERFYYRHRTKVVDGTRCNEESFDVCVDGTCQPVGCDMMLGSSAREDKCRECRGNNANCQTISGLLDTQELTKGYIDMLLIPQGATSIIIEEIAKSNNYLALRAKNGTYYLNGDYHIDFPRSLSIGGALWIYERSQQGFEAPDRLRCLGPTEEPLYLSLLLQGENVGIRYEYSVPKDVAPPRNKRYNWVHEEFTPCSAKCGGGFQTRNVTCRSREELELVDETLCEQEIKPPTNQSCNPEPCAAEWAPGPWGKCSKRCGKGGTRAREVHCMQVIYNGYPSIVADKKCFDSHGEKPELYEKCNVNATCPLWFTGPWKPCSALCDEGKQTRQVVCYQNNGGRIEKLSDEECEEEKPSTEKKCMLQPCEGVDWVASDWSKCDSCLSKEQTRTVVCATKEGDVVDNSFCAYHALPETKRPCDKTKLPPCDVQWYATQWSKCSVLCGKGFQYRKVFCGLFDGASVLKVDDSRCSALPKYNDTRECEIPQDECPAQWFTGPWTACNTTCGAGVRFRRRMCLANNATSTDCPGDQLPGTSEDCDSGPCDTDDETAILPLYDDEEYDDCEEEEYPEAGIESDTSSTPDDFLSTMFSDSPASEGSGMWSLSTVEHESTFPETEPTLASDELLTTESGSGTSEIDFTGIGETDDATDTSITEDTSSSGYESTTKGGTGSTSNETTSETDGTGSTNTDETDITGTDTAVTESSSSLTSESGGTDVTDETENEVTEETSESGFSVSDATDENSSMKTTSSQVTDELDYDDYLGLSEDEIRELKKIKKALSDIEASTPAEITEPEESANTSKTSESSAQGSTESGATDVDSSTKSTIPFYTFSEEDDSVATEKELMEETTPTETTNESASTESEGSTPSTEESESTVSELTSETSPSSSSEVTTESGETETTSESESTSEVSTEADTSEQSTESGATTESGSTSSDLTTESENTGSTETSESVSNTSELESTESPQTTELGSSETSVTTESGTTESGSTGDGGTTESDSTNASDTTESETTESSKTTYSDTTELSVTTESGSTESSITTEFGSTEASVTTESGSTESSITTEFGSTEASVTTESGSTETAVTTESSQATESETTESITTEAGTTESPETTYPGSTETYATTESGSTDETTESVTTESSKTTEGISESSVTEESTLGGLSTTEEGTTVSESLWDKSTKVEIFKPDKKGVCRRRSCTRSKFGCCPDKKTPALGPFDQGCPKPQTCKETTYGCCPDGVSPAQTPDYESCPVEPCAETLFGCCKSDNRTAAEGNDQEGCPPPPPTCLSTEFGCCQDESAATGPGKMGCAETSTTVTEITEADVTEPTSVSPSAPAEVSEVSEAAGAACADSEFGCCSDNATAAAGPERQGCPCESSQFGCCPDGTNAAQGPEFSGCAKTCNATMYGCCPDNKTPAHGPDYEGCCLLYAFGCCSDSHMPAKGPHGEGCPCQESHFGCCPDNFTAASGPDNKGCGCQYTQHGCCPDRHSEATGPDYEGCLCHTYQFGCCPDGVTIAQGPNGQGCYCQQSKYGCCSDEQTHAKGLNKEGCSCATSKHGCCLDGTTEATGPKFQGCSEKPENKQAACSLKFERGTCHNYSIKWYYDVEYGGCSRFWYGGCEGNGNRFASKEECEDTCVSPPPKDACKLPQIKGACANYHERWYFDNDREMCSNFVYSGCLGNNNNFETRELCQAQCEPERAIDQCGLPIERGSCAGNYPRWGYNKEDKHCEQFLWGGCEGNSNRFGTEAACLLHCNPPGQPQPECLEPQNVGNCTDTEAMWSFSQSENRCVPFYYTGCGGNGNKYYTKEDCEDACPSAFVPELCTLPASTGDCADYREKWYFDTTFQRCRQFYYGGCGGNGNKFDTEQECEARCSARSTPAPAPAPAPATPARDQDRSEFCFMELDSGPCSVVEPKWGYDYLQGRCVTFQYGGCGGNQNNFPTEEHCTYYCKPTQDICQLPMVSGPASCNESLTRWFYDAATDACSQFAYGGCGGNDNRFESREECESRCKTGPEAASPTPATTTTVQVQIEERVGESVPAECVAAGLEACSRERRGEVWYYDAGARACSPHENADAGAGCRTRGAFYSQEACERSCGAFRNINVCQYQMEAGPCKEFRPKYHYNGTSRRCEEFAYGGCFGSPNRFSTEQECEQTCMSTADPCTLPPEPGNCVQHIVMWYYDQTGDQCYQFAFGGCGGNENKFETREQCEGRCRKQPIEVTTMTPTPVQTPKQPEEEQCRTPTSLEPCGGNVTVYFYNEATRSCDPADFGGCNHPNSYRSEEECERRCGAFRGIDVCRYGLDPGPCRANIPKFFFDAASGSCKPYAYGGCHGGPNRFSTSEECEEVCSAAGPDRACLQEPAVGEQCGAVPERRWHYDVERGDCLVFAYQGCGGNRNNFASYEECADLCRVASSEPEESKICSQYAEECSSLDTTCPYGVRVMVAAEGCERCACEEPVDCEPQRRECDALRCRFGIERAAGDNGCLKCKCFEDPCIRSNCSSTERCVAAAYRDPTSQEIVYSAHCVPDEETNEILPDCNEYVQECARISCPYAVQRTRTSAGCERCTCVQEEVDCAPLERECEQLRCHYGATRNQSEDGCVRCKCKEHPCDGKECPSGQRCIATPFRDPITQEPRYSADCETINKPGQCPEVGGSAGNTPASPGCADDADCRGVLKCCARACLPPGEPAPPPVVTTHEPDIPRAPEASVDTEPQVAAAEGGKATLRCIFHGNPPPRITWRFGEITIDSDVDRYRLLSDGALEIVSLYRNDSGVYICVANNDLGSAEQQVTLNVHDPVEAAAGIAGAPGEAVTGELEGPAALRCLAYGYPPPAIYWFRGEGGPMVPFSSSLYEARGQELLIRRLTLDTLGEYLCQAYTGHGSAATMVYRVLAYRPSADFEPDHPYLVARPAEVAVTPRAPPRPAAPPTTTVQIPVYTQNVRTRVLPAATSYSAGAQVSVPCEVTGYPAPRVHWTKDSLPLPASDRLVISDGRLTIQQAQVGDSGEYACHAANEYSQHSSAVHITVQERYIPAKCVDNPTFANCNLIVQSRFCLHKYYSKFCCKSCVEAGQLDPRDAEMQADEPFRKK